jgi:hypothetical protein
MRANYWKIGKPGIDDDAEIGRLKESPRSRRHRVLPAAAILAGTPTEASHRADAGRARGLRAVRGVASPGR